MSSVSMVRSFSRELITSTLLEAAAATSRDRSVRILLSLGGACEPMVNDGNMMRKLKDNLKFAMDGSDVVSDVIDQIVTEETILEEQNEVSEAIIKIVENSTSLKTPLLILLIEKLRNLDEKTTMKRQQVVGSLLTDEDRAIGQLMKPHLIICSLITYLCENCQPSDIMEDDVSRMCDVVEVFFLRAMESKDEENLKFIFAIIACFFTASLDQEKLNHMKKLVPYLQKLQEMKISEEISEISFDLMVLIETKYVGSCGSTGFDVTKFSQSLQNQMNLVSDQHKKQSSKQEENAPGVKKQTKKLIEVIDDKPTETNHADHHNRVVTSFNEALESLKRKNEQAPIRVASLRYITSLVKKGEEIVIKSSEEVFNYAMMLMTTEQDSYVYLSAVQLISQLVIINPTTLSDNKNFYEVLIKQMEQLLQQKSNKSTSDGSVGINDEIFMKFGEVLSRVIEQFGDVASFHARKLLPLLLCGCHREHSSNIRITCLSNLAQLIPLLGHQSTSYQHELTECLSGMIRFDKNCEIRRGAVHLYRNIIEKMQSDIIEIFPDVIKQWSDLLKSTYENDDDETVRLQSQLALQSMKQMKNNILSSHRDSCKLQKKIVVMPPS